MAKNPKHLKLDLRHVKFSQVIPHPENPRIHPEKGSTEWEALRKSLAHSYFDPLIVNQRTTPWVIVSGHYRLKILIDEGFESADMVVVDWDEPTHRARMLAANELAGSFDDARLRDLLQNIGQEIPQDLTGLTDARLKELMDCCEPETVNPVDAEPQIDRAAELAKKWGVQTGQIWQAGQHRLMCGDSTKPEDVGRLMGGEVADLVFTDPPYNVDYVGKTKDALKIQNDHMDAAKFDAFLDASFGNFPLKKGGGFYVCSPPGCTETQFRNAIARTKGLLLKQCIVWVKDAFVMGRQDYHWRHESILYGWREGASHFFVDDRTKDTVWELPRPKQSIEHPTMKPLQVPEQGIRNSSKHNDIVFEGFSGSGTTMIACERLNRRCRAMEISPAYVAVALQRWADATGQTPTLL